jgi:hypothetical protein
MRTDVIGPIRLAGGPQVIAHADEIDLLYARVLVAPLATDELDSSLSLEIDHRVGQSSVELARAWRS